MWVQGCEHGHKTLSFHVTSSTHFYLATKLSLLIQLALRVAEQSWPTELRIICSQHTPHNIYPMIKRMTT